MNKLFILLALGSTTFASADPYNQGYGNGQGSCAGPACNNGGYYQSQPSNYQQNQRQNSGGYQRNDSNYDQNSYNASQQQRNQPYMRDQQRGPDRTYGAPSGGYMQTQPSDSNYQQGQRQDSSDFQRNDSNYSQPDGNQKYDQNAYDLQQQRNQPYVRDQQRNTDRNSGSQNSSNQSMVSDQELNKKIQDALSSGWFSKGFQNVSAEVNNGNVTLRGSVDTLENKNKAEENVKNIDGVKQVNNQISIAKETPNAYSPSQLQDLAKKYPQDVATSAQDRQLNAKIRDKLSNNWMSKNYETLVIKTANGIVIISGTVDKPEDVQDVNDQVKNVEGVQSVTNQLNVKNK